MREGLHKVLHFQLTVVKGLRDSRLTMISYNLSVFQQSVGFDSFVNTLMVIEKLE